MGSENERARIYFQDPSDRLRLLGVRRAVAVRVARHQIRTGFHQFAMEGDPRLILDALGRASIRAGVGRPRSGRPPGVVAAQASTADAAAAGVTPTVTGRCSARRAGGSGGGGGRALGDHAFLARDEDVVAEALDDEAHELLPQRKLARKEPQ